MINQKTEHRHLLLLILSNPKMPCVSIRSREVSQINHEGYSLKILDQPYRTEGVQTFSTSTTIWDKQYILYICTWSNQGWPISSASMVEFASFTANETIPMSTVHPRCSKTFSAISCRESGRTTDKLDRWNSNNLLCQKVSTLPILENVSSKVSLGSISFRN